MAGKGANPELRLDDEIRDVLPRLSEERRAELEGLIHEAGRCTDPLVTATDGTLLNGYERYEICTQATPPIPFEVSQVDVSGEAAKKVWRMREQHGKRNLNDIQKLELAERLEPLIRKAAAERRREGKRAGEHPEHLPRDPAEGSGEDLAAFLEKPGETRVKVPEAAGINRQAWENWRTIRKAEKDGHTQAPEWKRQAVNGEKTLGQVASDIRVQKSRDADDEARKVAQEAGSRIPDDKAWLQGDSRKRVGKLEPGSVALLLSDPPYGERWRGAGHRDIEADEDPEKAAAVLAKVLQEMEGKLAENAYVLLFCSADREISERMRQIVWDTGYLTPTSRNLTWDKTGLGRRHRDVPFAPVGEEIILAVKGNPRRGDLQTRNILSYPRESAVQHPTEKPKALLRELIEATTKEGDLVADPFGGVANTLVAAVETGRRPWGCEVWEDYYNVGKLRLDNARKRSKGLTPAPEPSPEEPILWRMLREAEEVSPSAAPFRLPETERLLAQAALGWLSSKPQPPSALVELRATDAHLGLAAAIRYPNLAPRVLLSPPETDGGEEEDDNGEPSAFTEVAEFWHTVLAGNGAERLAAKIRTFELDPDAAYDAIASEPDDAVERAFRLLLADRMSEGGLVGRAAMGEPIADQALRGERSAWETLAGQVRDHLEYAQGLVFASKTERFEKLGWRDPRPWWDTKELAVYFRNLADLAGLGKLAGVEGLGEGADWEPDTAYYISACRTEISAPGELLDHLKGLPGDFLAVLDDSSQIRMLARERGLALHPVPVGVLANADYDGREGVLLVGRDLNWVDTPRGEWRQQTVFESPPDLQWPG